MQIGSEESASNGHLVYAAPAPLSTEAGAVRIAVLALAALAMLAMIVLALVMMNAALVMAWSPRARSATVNTITTTAATTRAQDDVQRIAGAGLKHSTR